MLRQTLAQLIDCELYIVQLFGVVFLGIGLLLRFGLRTVLGMNRMSSDVIDSVLPFLSPTLNVAIIVFIVLGVFMLVVGVLGCAGPCCTVRVLLAVV